MPFDVKKYAAKFTADNKAAWSEADIDCLRQLIRAGINSPSWIAKNVSELSTHSRASIQAKMSRLTETEVANAK